MFSNLEQIILTGSEKDHSFVRNLVIQHMNGPMKEKLQNYMSDNMENYLDKSGMVEDSVWATDAEILATANLLNCDISVWSAFGTDLQWQRYPASMTYKRETDKSMYLENLGNHFNVVISV